MMPEPAESGAPGFGPDSVKLARAIWPLIRDQGPELAIAALTGAICGTLISRCTDDQRATFAATAIALIADAADDPQAIHQEIHGHA